VVLLFSTSNQMPGSLLLIMAILMIYCIVVHLSALIGFVLLGLVSLFFLVLFCNRFDFFLFRFFAFFLNPYVLCLFFSLRILEKNLVRRLLCFHGTCNCRLITWFWVCSLVLFLGSCLLLKINSRNVIFYCLLLKNLASRLHFIFINLLGLDKCFLINLFASFKKPTDLEK